MSEQLEQFGEAVLSEAQESAKPTLEEVVYAADLLTDQAGSSPCELDSAEVIEEEPKASAVVEIEEEPGEDVDFVNIVREDLVQTLRGADRAAYVYIVPVLDGKLYLGTVADQTALETVLSKDTLSDGETNYEPDKDIEPLVMPNRSKWDLAKYASQLVEKYGWDNIIVPQAQLEEVRHFYSRLGKSKEQAEPSQNKGTRKKKLIFKRKQAWPKLARLGNQFMGVLSVFKRYFTRRPRN